MGRYAFTVNDTDLPESCYCKRFHFLDFELTKERGEDRANVGLQEYVGPLYELRRGEEGAERSGGWLV